MFVEESNILLLHIDKDDGVSIPLVICRYIKVLYDINCQINKQKILKLLIESKILPKAQQKVDLFVKLLSAFYF